MSDTSPLAPFLAAVDLHPSGDHRFTGTNLTEGRGVVFGGQLLAQTIAAAARAVPDKQVKSLHTVFARGASAEAPLDIAVDPMHAGRAFASVTVTIGQGDRLCTRSLVLLDAEEPDLIRHAPALPDVSPPEGTAVATPGAPWWEIGIVGGVDISDPDAVGPAELFVWTRFQDAPADATIAQELLAYASDGFLIGTAMRPHAGVGQSMAHVSISTSVITHTLTFHEPFDAADWLLIAHEAPYAGRGRAYGRAHVFTRDGRHVASFVQESMIRDFPQGHAPAGGTPAKY